VVQGVREVAGAAGAAELKRGGRRRGHTRRRYSNVVTNIFVSVAGNIFC
jgi:hypothetical protein